MKKILKKEEKPDDAYKPTAAKGNLKTKEEIAEFEKDV
jgi:hypothetical protein